MRFFWALIFLSIASVGSAFEDEVLVCSGIEDEKARLACYDALAQTLKSSSGGECPRVELIDLQLDAEVYLGKCVETVGELFLSGAVETLTRPGIVQDEGWIRIILDELPRESRRELLECDYSCVAVVTGVVERMRAFGGEVEGRYQLKVESLRGPQL